ncbi:MAG: N-acetyltransferase [Deltaproteobacteria bacterium]|nr:N-acetyltransferase [Deltaproteobacteria bacterium]
MIVVRAEQPADVAGIDAVVRAAFGQPVEAELVAALRAAGRATLSLVALEDGAIVGHVLYSPVRISGAAADVPVLGLAPMAVRPDRQRAGIGTRLAEAGLAACAARGVAALVVLGHPEYYPRFGFIPASQFGLRCIYDAPDEAFMALELLPGALSGVAGVVHYAPEFDAV